jgi:hypothetical protein
VQVTRVLLGDDSGARLQMEVPLSQEHGDIRVRILYCGQALRCVLTAAPPAFACAAG